jgi:hypothetical protein
MLKRLVNIKPYHGLFINLLSRQRHYSALNIYLENLQSTIRDADINSYTQ